MTGSRVAFAQVEEEFAIQQFQAHLGMEAFHTSIFPRGAGLDVTRPDLATNSGPLSLRTYCGLRPLQTMTSSKGQPVDNTLCWKAAGSFAQQAFPGVFVDHGEDAHGATIYRAILDKVVAPDLVGPAGTARLVPGRARNEPPRADDVTGQTSYCR